MALVDTVIYLSRSNFGSSSREFGYGKAHLSFGDVVSSEETLKEDISKSENGDSLTGAVALRVGWVTGSRSGRGRWMGRRVRARMRRARLRTRGSRSVNAVFSASRAASIACLEV